MANMNTTHTSDTNAISTRVVARRRARSVLQTIETLLVRGPGEVRPQPTGGSGKAGNGLSSTVTHCALADIWNVSEPTIDSTLQRTSWNGSVTVTSILSR